MKSHHKDKFFKGLGISDAFTLINNVPLGMLNINPKDLITNTVKFNPTELMEMDLKAYRSDLIIELDYVILIFEFQSTKIYLDDKRRFNIYTSIKDRNRDGNKPIYLIVFSTVEKTQVIDYKINPESSFKILVISLKDKNGTEILNNIESKVKNNQEINQNDLPNLALSSLMTLETSIEEHLEKTVQTLDKLRNTIKKESEFVFMLVWILVDKFIENDETRERLSNILSDNMRLMEQFGQRRYNEGEQNGEKRGYEKGSDERSLEIAGRLLNDNMPIDKVSQMTDLSISQLELFNDNRI